MFDINSQALIQPNETPKAYRIRLYKNRDLYGLSVKEVGKLCNEAFGVSWDESAHRKKVKNYLEGYNDAKAEVGASDQQLQNMIEEDKRIKHEIDKQLKKIQTEKLEYSRWLREEARDELIIDKFCDAVRSIEPLDLPEFIPPVHNKKSYILAFGDEHYGAEFCMKDLFGNTLNEYSPEIFEKRMWDLYSQVVEFIAKERIDTLHIFSLGDFSDGIIRTSQLMKLRYGVVDGTIKYANFISVWLNALSKYVHIEFSLAYGNHTELRMLGAPKGTFMEDNMTKFVSELVKVRLEGNPNFRFVENPTRHIYTKISGYNILGFHGEVKNMELAIKDFSKVYGVQIDYLIAGHYHHSATSDTGMNSEVINVPSIVGADPHSLSLFKVSNAGAKMLVFEEQRGLVCDYRMKLN